MIRRRTLFAAALCLVAGSATYQWRGVSALSSQTQGVLQHPKRVSSREAILLQRLRTLLEPVGISVDKSMLIDIKGVKESNELVIKWDAYPEESGDMVPADKVKNRPVGKGMRLEKVTKRKDSLEERFALNFTDEHLFIAAVDDQSRLVWWTVKYDPRIVRGHTLGPNGEMAGVLYYRTRTGIVISPPAAKEISEIRIFQPKWTGTQFILEQLSTVSVSQ